MCPRRCGALRKERSGGGFCGAPLLPKVARALGRFVKYVRALVEEVKRELGVENVEADLKSLDREVKDTMKDMDIRQDLQKTQLDMNKEFKKIDKELSFKDFKDQLKKGGT